MLKRGEPRLFNELNPGQTIHWSFEENCKKHCGALEPHQKLSAEGVRRAYKEAFAFKLSRLRTISTYLVLVKKFCFSLYHQRNAKDGAIRGKLDTT